MYAYAIVLSSLLLLACPQLLLAAGRGNLQAEEGLNASSQADQAAGFVLAHYPQLANLSRVSVSIVGRRGNGTSKAANLLVVLSDNQTTQASAIVAFY